MYSDNPFFESIDHWVIVWIGDLKLEELEDYLDEPGNAADNEPISDFSRDLGRWYDHDFIWAEGSDEQVSLRKLCELNGVEPSEFVDEIEQRGGDVKARSLLVLWNAKAIDESPRPFAEGQLKCIGCWQQESPLTD
jgi:hypothetical protein